MKKSIIPIFAALALMAASCDQYDDSAIREKVDAIEQEVSSLKTQLTQINGNISSLQSLVGALQSKDYVTAVDEVKNADGQVIGHKIIFSNEGEVYVYDGQDGAPGYTPSISVKKDSDGKYYWTLDGEFIVVDGQKISAEGAKGDEGAQGTPGAAGATPQLRINEGNWEVSYDGGESWTALGEVSGAVASNIKVEYDEESVTFILEDGEITLPRVPAFALKVEYDEVGIAAGKTVEIAYTVKGADENDKVVVYVHHASAGYSAEVAGGKIKVTAPDPLVDGIVVVEAVNNTTGAVSAQAISFEDGVLSVATDSYVVPAAGAELEISISTNVDYEVKVPVAASTWISVAATRAVRVETITLVIAENLGEARTAEVSIEGTDGSVATIAISQNEATDDVERVQNGTGFIEVLFGMQPLEDNPQGFTGYDNRTMAVVGDYIILSNASDYKEMPVYNRWTGEYLPEVKVNTTGIDADAIIHAITTDDAGHLVAMSYVNNNDSAVTDIQPLSTSTNVRVWAWESIDQAPRSLVWSNIGGGTFTQAPVGINSVTKLEIGRTVSAYGDIFSGDAVLATASKTVPRPVFLFFKDGGFVDSKAYVEWPSGSGIPVSFWNGTKVVPLNADKDALKYFWSSANFRSAIIYSNAKSGLKFDQPSSHWWPYTGPTPEDYSHPVLGIDYIEFNGAHLLAVANGFGSGAIENVNQNSWRLYVADVTENPTTSSLSDGLIFDSRQGKADSYQYSLDDKGIGACAGIAGMTSRYSFTTGSVLSGNMTETGDVAFAKGPDGHSVQVYLMTTGQGMFGYNITDIAK